MNVCNHIGPCQRQQIAIIQQVLVRILKALAANVRLRQAIAANRGAHRAIEHENAIFRGSAEFKFKRRAGKHGRGDHGGI